MYVYLRSEPNLWTVGFYTPAGKWEPDSDHDSPGKAVERVRYLNGSDSHRIIEALRAILDEARSGLPVHGMYADMGQYYRAKVNRIAAMADAALNQE